MGRASLPEEGRWVTSIARERLTEIMPQLLRALANAGDPDTAFVTFDRFIAGLPAAYDPAAVPAVVFTDPEIAWAGLMESEARDRGVEVEVVRFPWAASGRATTLDRSEGLTKLIVEPRRERVLGIAVVGAGAGELIGEGALAIEMGARVSDLMMTIHAHPTLSETIMESAGLFFGASPHFKSKKRGRP